MNIDRCPSTLVPGFTSYSPAGLRKLFDGKKVSPILPYDAPGLHGEPEEFLKNREHISISGVQEKLSVIVDQGTIRLTKSGEQGTHLLKPISSRLARASDMPANEHVTMQIAAQLFGISTAPNGLCFFRPENQPISPGDLTSLRRAVNYARKTSPHWPGKHPPRAVPTSNMITPTWKWESSSSVTSPRGKLKWNASSVWCCSIICFRTATRI